MRKCNTRRCWLKYTSALTMTVWNVIKIESRHINRVRLICINTPSQKCAFNPSDAHGFRKVNKLPHLGRDGGGRREEAQRAHLMQIQKSTYSNGHICPEHLLFWPHIHNPYEEKNPYTLSAKWFWTLKSHLKIHECMGSKFLPLKKTNKTTTTDFFLHFWFFFPQVYIFFFSEL